MIRIMKKILARPSSASYEAKVSCVSGWLFEGWFSGNSISWDCARQIGEAIGQMES